jgi:hypothetical protein
MPGWLLGAACIVAGVALVFIARPNREGVSPRFLRSGSMQMLYPTICLGMFVVGVALLFRD